MKFPSYCTEHEIIFECWARDCTVAETNDALVASGKPSWDPSLLHTMFCDYHTDMMAFFKRQYKEACN